MLDCKSPAGITVSLIDTILTSATLLGDRLYAFVDHNPEEVQEALKDLASDDNLRRLLRLAQYAAKLSKGTDVYVVLSSIHDAIVEADIPTASFIYSLFEEGQTVLVQPDGTILLPHKPSFRGGESVLEQIKPHLHKVGCVANLEWENQP